MADTSCTVDTGCDRDILAQCLVSLGRYAENYGPQALSDDTDAVRRWLARFVARVYAKQAGTVVVPTLGSALPAEVSLIRARE